MTNKLNEYPKTAKYIESLRTRYFWKVDEIQITQSVYNLYSNELMYVAIIHLSAKVLGSKIDKKEHRTIFMPLSKQYCDETEAKIL